MNFPCRQKTWFRLPMILFFVAGFSLRADAHLVTTGLGPLYDGMSHLLLSPEEWIMIVGLGLLAGLHGPATGRFVLFSLPCAWLLGGSAGHFIHLTLPSLIPSVALLIVGGLVSTDLKAGRNIVTTIAVVLGFLQGYINGTSLNTANGVMLALLGSSIVTFVIVAFGAALVVDVRGWQRIVVRVAGSWITAIGILLVGWTIRKSWS